MDLFQDLITGHAYQGALEKRSALTELNDVSLILCANTKPM